MNHMVIDGIHIEVIQKNIRSIRFSVHQPEGRVRLAVPHWMNQEEIRRAAIQKLSWIKKQRSRIETLEKPPERAFVTGEYHAFLGSQLQLNVIEVSEKRQKQRGERQCHVCLNLYVKPGHTMEKREEVLYQWYRDQLKALVPQYIEKWEQIIGVEVVQWGIKRMKTRWGTCNVKARRIWINLELARKSSRCLEYIVVHEMVHLLERSHNQRFKELMDHFLPDWRDIRAELNPLNKSSVL